MGFEAEPEPSSTPKLPLFSIPPMPSPEHSGTLTPPLHTIASVPFRWEEEPGKPRPCTTLTMLNSAAKCLELPPRLFSEAKLIKMPSPTTVLEGPYVGKSNSLSSSFRMGRDSLGSFGDSTSPDKVHVGAIVLCKRRHSDRGLFGSWGWGKKGKRDVGGGSFVFSSATDIDDVGAGESNGDRTAVNLTKIRRKGSFLRVPQAKSHFWGTIYEGLKQVIPWRGRKLKKDGLVI